MWFVRESNGCGKGREWRDERKEGREWKVERGRVERDKVKM